MGSDSLAKAVSFISVTPALLGGAVLRLSCLIYMLIHNWITLLFVEMVYVDR